jgi:hypothetical protein
MTPLAQLHDSGIYEDIGELGLAPDLQGWHSDRPVFARLIDEVRPEIILEAGSWRGASAIHMARVSMGLAPLPHLFCIDTWLGSLDMILRPDRPGYHLPRRRGYPQVYFQFLHNVAGHGFTDRITPVPMTSQDGARWCAFHGIRAKLIYIDGSHLYADVLADLAAFWELLLPGGAMFGDDWCIRQVRRAVEKFARLRGLVIAVEEGGIHWILRKP